MAGDVPKREHEARALIDARSQGGRCELCGRLGTNVHHRNKRGRVWVASNLLRLCGSGTTGCHGWIEHHPEYAMALGLWVPRELDPAEAPAYCAPIMFRLEWWQPDDAGMWHPCSVNDVTRYLFHRGVHLTDMVLAVDALSRHLGEQVI
jgi:hypothetical protein